MAKVLMVALLPGGLLMVASAEGHRTDEPDGRFEAPSLEEALRGEAMTIPSEPGEAQGEDDLINGFAADEWDMALKIFEQRFEATPEEQRDAVIQTRQPRPEGFPEMTPRKIVEEVRQRTQIGALYVMSAVMRIAMGG